jgi:DNA (cytosine-5)-methyltransferase 1
VDILWASTECTQHSRAKGGADKEIGSYTLGWELPRYIKHCRPSVIHIENVPEFVKWSPVDEEGKPDKSRQGEEFNRWVKAIQDLGYPNYEHRFLNAADFGCPTRRIRYFGIFTAEGIEISWPEQTHAEKQFNGFKKWVPCREYLNLDNEGVSIFGREFNQSLPKQHRHSLSVNTLKRIAGGIRKFAPEMYFLMTYHGSGHNCQSLTKPIFTISTVEAKALIKVEKQQFIQDHCHMDSYNGTDEPLNPQLTRETKQLITIEKQFLDDQYGRIDTAQPIEKPTTTITCANSKRLVTAKLMVQHYKGDHSSNINGPLPTITTVDHNAIVTAKAQFISKQYNSNGHPEANNQSLDEPLGAMTTEPKNQIVNAEFISHHYGKGFNQGMDEPMRAVTTKEKIQFVSAYFNSNGHPESQNQSIDKPLNTIVTEPNKKAMVTADMEAFDFDIKMRFLNAHDELAPIMGFPKGYFKGFSKKAATKMIGNAVPTGMARVLIEETKRSVEKAKEAAEIYL